MSWTIAYQKPKVEPEKFTGRWYFNNRQRMVEFIVEVSRRKGNVNRDGKYVEVTGLQMNDFNAICCIAEKNGGTKR